jgi:hypothetical protein
MADPQQPTAATTTPGVEVGASQMTGVPLALPTGPQVVVPFATPVSVGTGPANALQLLGWTVNGCEINHENVWEDVPGDQGGGEGGIPIDVQMFGQIARIHLEMSKWDPAVQNLLEASVNANGTQLNMITAGKTVVPGTLNFQNFAFFRLLINPPQYPTMIRNYPLCLPREPHVVNIGTRWARLVTDWIAYPNLMQSPPLLWDNTTT